MPLQRVQLPGQRSLASEIYDWLASAIVTGDLQPNERLVEAPIAALASVSRTPVRQALHRLTVDGLVRAGFDGTLTVAGLSIDELADLCAVRETLEGMATGLAAVSHSEIELEGLRRIVDEEVRLFDEGDEAVARRVELNHTFHEILYGASRNRYLAEDLRRLRNLIERIQDTTLRSTDRAREANVEHRQIIEALESRDATAADELARLHFRHAMARRLGHA
jgi:DNA-binding GntR family transcriptional regulator